MKKPKIDLDLLIWKFLRISKIFDYWYKRHITQLIFDLEIARDIPGECEELRRKFIKKLKKFNS